MKSIARPLRRGSLRAVDVMGSLLFAVATAAIFYLTFNLLLWTLRGAFPPNPGATRGLMVLAGLTYLMAHAFRTLRLALLIGGWRVGLRRIASFHCMTAAASLTAPLKLGEAYRVLALPSIAGGVARGIAVACWERLFDAALILLLLVLALSDAGSDGSAFAPIAALTVLFMAVMGLVFGVLPDNLRRLSVLIIRRYDSPATVPVMRLLDVMRRSIHEAPHLLRGKVASVAALTCLIWTCEIGSFMLAVPELAGSFTAARATLLGFLSALTQGETLLYAVQHQNVASLGGGRLLSYLAVTQVPLAFTGAVAAGHLLYLRLRP